MVIFSGDSIILRLHITFQRIGPFLKSFCSLLKVWWHGPACKLDREVVVFFVVIAGSFLYWKLFCRSKLWPANAKTKILLFPNIKSIFRTDWKAQKKGKLFNSSEHFPETLKKFQSARSISSKLFLLSFSKRILTGMFYQLLENAAVIHPSCH